MAVVLLGLAFCVSAGQPGPKKTDAADGLLPFLEEFQVGPKSKARDLPLFLDDFHADKEIHLLDKEVSFPSAVGRVRGYWARPKNQERLPAVLLVHDEEAWTTWMKTNVRHLASIGYEVLVINVHQRRLAASKSPSGAFTDEATLAELSAGVRWLRSRAEVLPNRCGVVGWGWSGGQALALASAVSMQACVVCDAPMPNEPSLLIGLQGTPLLGIFAEENKVSQKELPAFAKLLAKHQIPSKFHLAKGAKIGFMGPPEQKAYAHDTAEDAWVVMYNFLEKYVEDARPPGVPAEPAEPSVATVADIMRAVNEPAGLRGALSRALEQEPKNGKQWDRIRANAALVAESGVWLQMRTPSRGPANHWKEQAKAFTLAAEAIVTAADRRDYPAARRGLVHLATQCASCHDEHR